MAEYFNQVNVKITEVAILSFNHVVNDEIDYIEEIVCPIQFVPEIANILNQAYTQYIKSLEDQKRDNEKNKSLS
jgi:hypothetical protein